MLYIAPSLLAADFSDLQTEIRRMEDSGANYLHLDIMDGHFVPNISFGAGIVKSIRKHTRLFFDVHLMISEPLRYAEDFIRAGADIITFHYEAVEDPKTFLNAMHSFEMPCGIAISPKTPVDVLYPFINDAKMFLIMTVEPGFGGQALIPETLDKVRNLRRYAIQRGINVNIEVDGGINAENAPHCTEAGANILVSGSALFKDRHPKATVQRMREAYREHPFLG